LIISSVQEVDDFTSLATDVLYVTTLLACVQTAYWLAVTDEGENVIALVYNAWLPQDEQWPKEGDQPPSLKACGLGAMPMDIILSKWWSTSSSQHFALRDVFCRIAFGTTERFVNWKKWCWITTTTDPESKTGYYYFVDQMHPSFQIYVGIWQTLFVIGHIQVQKSNSDGNTLA